MTTQLSRLALMTGRKVYYPNSKRKPVLVDPWYIIIRRVKAAQRVRSILFGGTPPHVPDHRLQGVWAWKVREFVHRRDFRYIELLNETRRFVELYGHIDPSECTTREEILELDLDAIKAWERYIASRRTELETWRKRGLDVPVEEKLASIAAQTAKELALLGVCAICGNDLPCEDCGLPAVEMDGRGGIRPKTA